MVKSAAKTGKKLQPGSILEKYDVDNDGIEYLESDIFIEDQSVVYTSGSGGLFKSGIPVGIYYKATENESEKVKFFSKLSQLTFVKLISFEESKK